jgi:NAD(P)-dependent dehydrogenase (short-subunit alcohol dehydrogenase family)
MSADRPVPPFPEQRQDLPGTTSAMRPVPDHGETSYHGSNRLSGKAVLITGGDSGIGRAVAIAFAREGADLLISYLDEHEDARDTARRVEKAGQRAITVAGDVSDEAHCRALVKRAIDEFGRVDVLINNAAYQMSHPEVDKLSAEELDHTFRTNVYAMFWLTQAALPHMRAGSAIINTTSINADKPNPTLLAYAATKGAIANYTAGLAQMLADKGIRVNSVAPGPIWTPLIPSSFPPEKVAKFGQNYPMKRPGQPAEVAPVYVLLASDEASYISGAMIPVTGGQPVL